MSPTGYSLRASVWQTLTRTRPPDTPAWVVVRNAAAVTLPLAAGLATGHAALGLGVAAGALNVMFSDQPGPYRQRIARLLLASLATGLAGLVGFLVGAHLAPMLLATLAFGFGGGLLVVFGVDMARVGMSSIIVLVITASQPTTLSHAAAGSLLLFGGGLLLGSLSIAAWPLQRYRPERASLSTVYRGLARMMRQRQMITAADTPELSEAMNTLQQTLHGRHRARGRAMEAFVVLLDLAERIRLQLIALAELDRRTPLPGDFMAHAALVLEQIAKALDAGRSPREAETALRALQQRYALHPGQRLRVDGASRQHALIGELAAAVRNADWAGSRGELRAAAAEKPLPGRLRSNSALAMLRANLTPESVAFRHALRSAAALTAAVLLARALQLPHGYWLPMTVAIVLRPDFAATFSFGFLRVVGTIAGLLLTTALLYITPDQPWAHLMLMALLCVAFRYMAVVHYGLAVAALTGAVVILLSFEGVSPGAAVVDRVINTALGSGLALLAYMAWPTWERFRASTALADLLDAYAAYLSVLADPALNPSMQLARIAVRRERTNAVASVERLHAEPGAPALLLEKCDALLAHSHRLARTAMAIESELAHQAELPEQREVAGYLQHSAAAVTQLAGALRQNQSLPQDVTELRALQHSLASLLTLAEPTAAATDLIHLSDRLLSNIAALAHAASRPEPHVGSTPLRELRH